PKLPAKPQSVAEPKPLAQPQPVAEPKPQPLPKPTPHPLAQPRCWLPNSSLVLLPLVPGGLDAAGRLSLHALQPSCGLLRLQRHEPHHVAHLTDAVRGSACGHRVVVGSRLQDRLEGSTAPTWRHRHEL